MRITMALLFAIVLALFSLLTPFVASAPFPAPDLKRCSLAFNSNETCCTLPGPRGPLKPFDFNRRLPMRTRPAAHLLDDAYIAKYQRAVELMRALPETDGRSFVAQYRLHCAYCNNHLHYEGLEYPLEIHQNWFFLPWHRLYMYFHERILAKLIGDDDFALPFWNWDNQDSVEPFPNAMPRAFVEQRSLSPDAINRTSSLYDPDRNNCSQPPRLVEFQDFVPCFPQNVTEDRIQNAHLLWTQAVSAGVTPMTMHGAPYRFGDMGGMGMGAIEGRPHGPVHVWTNMRDMGTFKDSASDPIFFAHHANIDRMWELWRTFPGKYRKDVTDPDYLNAAFTFYDEDGEQVSVTIAQSLDPNLMRVKYQEMPIPWANEGRVQPHIDPQWGFCNPNSDEAGLQTLISNTRRFKGPIYVKTGPVTFKLKRRPWMTEHHGEEMLELKARFDWHGQHLVNMFAFLPNSSYEATSIGCLEYLGDMLSFPHVGMSPALAPELTFRMGIRRKLELMQRANMKDLVITIVGESSSGMTGVTGESGFELTSAKIIYSKD